MEKVDAIPFPIVRSTTYKVDTPLLVALYRDRLIAMERVYRFLDFHPCGLFQFPIPNDPLWSTRISNPSVLLSTPGRKIQIPVSLIDKVELRIPHAFGHPAFVITGPHGTLKFRLPNGGHNMLARAFHRILQAGKFEIQSKKLVVSRSLVAGRTLPWIPLSVAGIPMGTPEETEEFLSFLDPDQALELTRASETARRIREKPRKPEKRFAFLSGLKPPQARRVRGIARCVYLGTVPILLALIVYSFKIDMDGESLKGYALGAVVVLVWWLYARFMDSLIRQTRRLDALSADEVMASDDRKPIIYLRSFDKDSTPAHSSDQGGAYWGGALRLMRVAVTYGLGLVPLRWEEQLFSYFRRLGPFITIGKPGEELPKLGAARLYCDNASWQNRVKELVEMAQIVIWEAGNSPGLWWEFKHLVKTVDPKKVILFLPFNVVGCEVDAYDDFRIRACSVLEHATPAVFREASYLYFDDGWKPRAARLFISVLPRFFSSSAVKLKKSLRPFFRRKRAKKKEVEYEAPPSPARYIAWTKKRL